MEKHALDAFRQELSSHHRPLLLKRLPECATVEVLLKEIAPATPKTPAIEVFEAFLANPQRYAIPVVAEGRPVGLINRNTLIELFSKPYSRELYGRREISAFMDSSPIIVDKRDGIDDVARIIIDAGMQYMYDGFIITDGKRYLGMGTGHDLLNEITERKQAHLFYLAHYDQLTGLPNRLLFNDRLAQACSRAKRNREKVALLFIDLDRFKFVNDELGHPVGDLLLKAVAQRLQNCTRTNDTIARLGGDEFTVILQNVASAQDAAIVARKILEAMIQPFHLAEHEVFISASVGIALFPADSDEPDDLIKKADSAMYHAKEVGKNNYQFYSAEMNVAISERLSTENHLRRALERDEFRLHYQPQVDLACGQITAVEALLRWQHPLTGMVPPAQFIPLAEETGLIVPIGEYVLRAACRQNKAWQDAGLPPLRVAVNISVRQLKQANFVEMVAGVLRETGLEARYLELELTENMLLDHADKTIAKLRDLHAMGVHLSIDDFGTGYSSLSYLKRLPIQTLKIDRSFIHDVCRDADDAAITTAIIAMAHRLKLTVVAEGLETEDQLAFLHLHRCNLVQGYYFSRPVPADQLVELLKKRGQLKLARPEAPSVVSAPDPRHCPAIHQAPAR